MKPNTLFKKCSDICLKSFAYLMLPFDKLLTHYLNRKKAPSPIFIIGPPRSGSTLLYQTMVDRYNFSYFTNLSGKFYTAPVLPTYLSKYFLLKKPPEKYQSEHGRTNGLLSPNECGQFWYQWFPKGMHIYVPPKTTPKNYINKLKKTINAMSLAVDSPMLFKNMQCCMRIAPIFEAFPDASFIVCRRNPIDIAQSLLNARLKLYNDINKWWSIPPKEIDEIIKHPYYEQVVEQVYYIYKQIDEDRNRFGNEHFLDISYEKFCNDTYKTLNKIESFLNKKGHELTIKGEIPDSFPISSGTKVNEDDYNLIVEEVNKRDWRR